VLTACTMDFLLLALVAILAFAIHWFVRPLLEVWSLPDPVTVSFTFYDPATNKRASFPLLFESSSVFVSLIVPAYNEQYRLEDMLNETLKYLTDRQQRKKSFTYEIIIVDDGSRDRTGEVALAYVKRYGSDNIRLLQLGPNQGKGAAVQHGMLHARGDYLLMVDADGATRIQDLDNLERAIKKIERNGHGIAVGSRAHLQKNAVAKRKWYRNLLMYGFHFVVWMLCVRNVRDTQCGFKLFTRASAQRVFVNQRLKRWCFDVELLYIAECFGIPMIEVDVNWNEIPGSKLSIGEASIQMGRDLVLIRLMYASGIWRLRSPPVFQSKKKAK